MVQWFAECRGPRGRNQPPFDEKRREGCADFQTLASVTQRTPKRHEMCIPLSQLS